MPNHPTITEPCPFCGAAGRELKLGTTDNDGRGQEFCFVYCTQCHGEGPPVAIGGQDFSKNEGELAVYKWNDRYYRRSSKEAGDADAS